MEKTSMHWLVKTCLVITISMGALFFALFFIMMIVDYDEFIEGASGTESPAFMSFVVMGFFLAISITSFLILKYRKIGFWLALGSFIVFLILFVTSVEMDEPDTAAGPLSFLILPAVLYGILQIRNKGKSAWEQLD